MRVIIAGSRALNETARLNAAIALWKEAYGEASITEVVSGGARGADRLGEAWARAQGLPITRFPAEWRRYGKAAGPIRNRQMAAYADGLIALPGGGRGTRSMIAEAQRRGLPILIG